MLGFPVHVYGLMLLAGGVPLALAVMPNGTWWLAPGPVLPGGGGAGGPGKPAPRSALANLAWRTLLGELPGRGGFP